MERDFTAGVRLRIALTVPAEVRGCQGSSRRDPDPAVGGVLGHAAECFQSPQVPSQQAEALILFTFGHSAEVERGSVPLGRDFFQGGNDAGGNLGRVRWSGGAIVAVGEFTSLWQLERKCVCRVPPRARRGSRTATFNRRDRPVEVIGAIRGGVARDARFGGVWLAGCGGEGMTVDRLCRVNEAMARECLCVWRVTRSRDETLARDPNRHDRANRAGAGSWLRYDVPSALWGGWVGDIADQKRYILYDRSPPCGIPTYSIFGAGHPARLPINNHVL